MANRMWKDSEAELDFLNFNYLAEQVVEISKDDKLSPATIGVYGDWGSGKSSLMKMVSPISWLRARIRSYIGEFCTT